MLQSATRILMRAVLYVLVTFGVISAEIASIVANDPDVQFVVSGVLGIVVAEIAVRLKRYLSGVPPNDVP